MFQDLTLQQLCSLDYSRNMVVTAGPGAGKTKVLSHRFCYILLTDHSVSLPQILTLTFTEKAAEEMKARIYEMLSRSEDSMSLNVDEVVKQKIREAREQFQKNHISTIHAFCAKLLRENPVESEIDPGFAVIQGAKQRHIMEQAIERGVSIIWQNNKDDLISLMRVFGGRKNLLNALQKITEHPFILERVIRTKERLFHVKGWEEQVFKDYCYFIKEHCLMPYLEGLRGLQNRKGQYAELLSILEDGCIKAEKEAEYLGVPDVFKKLRVLVADRKPSQSKLSVSEGLGEISYVDLVEEFYPDLFLYHPPDSLFGRQLDFFLKIAESCKNIYQDEKEKVNGLDFADLEARSHRFLMKLNQDPNRFGIKRIQNRFKYIMVDEFQDTNRVQWDIIRFLCSDKGSNGEQRLESGKLFIVGDKRQAIYKFRGGDVTVFQSVIDEIISSNPDPPPSLFWQDSQINQYLGRIDRGYPEFIKDKERAFDSLPGVERDHILKGNVHLPHNFRTHTDPIHFLNRAFDRIFSNKGAERLERYETAPKPTHLPENKKVVCEESGSVTAYLTRTSNMDGDKTEAEASLIIDIIERLLGRHGKDAWEYRYYPDIREKIEKNQLAIGILFFSYSRIKTFESLFREAALPFSIHRGKGFYRCPEVMDMVQLLSYLSDERETISLLAVLRSPIFGITDPEIFDLFYGTQVTLAHLLDSLNAYIRAAGEQIQSWRTLSNRLTLPELIRTVISDRSLIAIHSIHPNGIQRLANMEKFIEIARRFQREGNGALSEFVEYCLQMAEEDDEEGEAMIVSEGDSPICLMTIHAAKGLEFPMVIIPELGYHLPFKANPGKPVRLYASKNAGPGSWNSEEGELPVWPIEIPKLDYLKQKSPLCYLLLRQNRLEDMAEKKRVFYVACTRTMSHLVLLGTMNSRMMEENKRSLSSEDYRERATIMDLLNDQYRFTLSFPPDEAEIFRGHEGLSWVIWRDVEPRPFKGIKYADKRIKRQDLGIYDNRIKEIDLTEPIKSHPYLQISFHALHLFRQCPVLFYFRVILGLNPESPHTGYVYPDISLPDDTAFDPMVDKAYQSGEAILMGNLIHGYLEKHHFGDSLDEKRLTHVWRNLTQNPWDMDGLSKERLASIKERALDQIQTTIHDEDLLALLKGQTDYREVPFLFRIGQECDFRGVIDRLFRDKGSGKWIIIDWKSNDLTNRDPFQVIEENDYHLQLACYGWAIERILNEKSGDRYIYFTDKGQLIRSQWDDHPKEVVDDMLQYLTDDNIMGRQQINRIRERKRDMGQCLYCEYAKGFCG
jgi:ATP-dependent helicase/nuclease subunit A